MKGDWRRVSGVGARDGRSLKASIAFLGVTVMITVEQCAAFAGLAPNKIVLGATPSATHRVLLSGYLLNLWRGPKAVRKMIVADIHMWLDLGMPDYAADLLIVLRRFLSDYPEGRLERQSRKGANENKGRRLIT